MAERELLNYKPIMQRFVEANGAFIDCLSNQPKDDISSMSAAQLDSVCQSEKIAIKSILESNKMTMTTVVKDRLNIMNALKQVETVYKEEHTEI